MIPELDCTWLARKLGDWGVLTCENSQHVNHRYPEPSICPFADACEGWKTIFSRTARAKQIEARQR